MVKGNDVGINLHIKTDSALTYTSDWMLREHKVDHNG